MKKIDYLLLVCSMSAASIFAQSLPDNVKELEKIAKKNVDAQAKLGRMYYTGEGIGIVLS